MASRLAVFCRGWGRLAAVWSLLRAVPDCISMRRPELWGLFEISGAELALKRGPSVSLPFPVLI